MPKRPRGSGSLYKPRGSRFWWTQVRTETGRLRESTRKTNRQEAEKILAVRLGEVASGLRRAEPKSLTVADLLEELRRDYQLNERASLPQLDSRIKNHLAPALGLVRAVNFGSIHVTDYQRRRKRKGAKPATINRELEHVRAAFARAVEDGVLSRAPKIRMLSVENVRTGFLEHVEYRSLRVALPAYLRALFVVSYYCGCRLGELLKLKWSQVDFTAGQIWLEPGKTKDKTARVLPIYRDMETELRQAFRFRNENFPNCPWVFSHGGRRIVDLRKAWHTACKLAGVEITFHDLRRTAARNMDRAGVPHNVIKRIMGHKTDAMFSRYRIVAQSDLAEAARKAEGLFARLDAEAGASGGVIQ